MFRVRTVTSTHLTIVLHIIAKMHDISQMSLLTCRVMAVMVVISTARVPRDMSPQTLRPPIVPHCAVTVK